MVCFIHGKVDVFNIGNYLAENFSFIFKFLLGCCHIYLFSIFQTVKRKVRIDPNISSFMSCYPQVLTIYLKVSKLIAKDFYSSNPVLNDSFGF